MGKIKKNDNLIIKDLMSSYKSRDLGCKQLSTSKTMINGNGIIAKIPFTHLFLNTLHKIKGNKINKSNGM